MGFEPTRGDPIGLAGRRLSHSAKVSDAKYVHGLDLKLEKPLSEPWGCAMMVWLHLLPHPQQLRIECSMRMRAALVAEEKTQ